ncbi:catalytic subunit of chitin synthase III [Hamiltosporidium magnivora]|uniref:Catalytic subunit of chitin synthase III n=2 Tax=Hamiltosporidium magnivora TaxID=148818 RepID=A0A4Q9LLA9_9MICR|nr:catalytic subunit of chitin synthase III [Hamiltosporidium magnivora]
MDILNLNHTCSEINLPLCKVLKDTPCGYTGRSLPVFGTNLNTFFTIIILLAAMFCTFRMIKGANKKYSAVGRKEMVTFFYMYLATISLETVLVSGVLKKNVLVYLTSLQLSFANSTVFCLFIGGLTSTSLVDIGLLKSILIVRVVTFVYFVTSIVVIYMFLMAKNSFIICFFTFILNLGLAFLYLILQVLKLIRLDAEVWAYGTLIISALFFMSGILPLFFGSEYIALLSDRYLDGLFFFHLFIFCGIIMIHKYWLSVCENEAECISLIVKGEIKNV